MLRAPSTSPSIRACRTRPRLSAPVELPPSPPARFPDFDTARAAFLEDLQFAGRARWTRKKHDQELRRFARWLEAEGLSWYLISAPDLAAYLRTRAGLGESARGATVCALRRFYGWLAVQGVIATSPAATLAIPPRGKHPPKALTRAQVRTLVAHLRRSKRVAARRDEALIILMLYAGLRAGEAARLCWRDYDADAGIITIWEAKANKGRCVTVHGDAAAALGRWRSVQGGAEDAPIFDWQGAPLVSARIGRIAKKASQRSDVRFTAHVLRHTFATWAYRESRDLYAVSKALGHSELKTTEIYVYADPESMRPALDQLPGIDDW